MSSVACRSNSPACGFEVAEGGIITHSQARTGPAVSDTPVKTRRPPRSGYRPAWSYRRIWLPPSDTPVGRCSAAAHCAMQSLLFGLSASLAQCPAAQNDRATVIITFRCIFSSSLVRQPRVHLHSFLSLMMFIASSTLKLTLLRSCWWSSSSLMSSTSYSWYVTMQHPCS